MTELPTVSPIFFEPSPRRLTRVGNSLALSVPQVWAQALQVLQTRRAYALVLRNYLIYTPEPFTVEERRQLLDIAMTALEALVMLEHSERRKEVITEAWEKLKQLEDEYFAEG